MKHIEVPECEIVVLTGFSGAGKDTLAKKLLEKLNYESLVGQTTRTIRNEEVDGNEYFFVSNEEMLSDVANGKILELREYQTIYGKWFYGTNVTKFEKNKKYIKIADLDGAMFFKSLKNVKTTVIFIDCPDEIRKERCKTSRKEFSEEEWNRRLEDDNNKYGYDYISKADYIVQNINLEKALKKIENILNKGKEND